MTKLFDIYLKHTGSVRLSCDEYHLHSATKGCLVGPKDSVEICILWEEVLRLRSKLQEIEKLSGGFSE